MSRANARRLAREALRAGRPLDWFEELYAEADVAGASHIPWADCTPNPNLVAWLDSHGLAGEGKPALKVGCGLGDDAEELSRRGFDVTAFDISKSAVAAAQRRFPGSAVSYQAADLFCAPAAWAGRYELVLESYTLQVLPPPLRLDAIGKIASFVASRGRLLVITRARDGGDPPGEMPWPLTRQELKRFEEHGLEQAVFEDYLDNEDPPVRRFRVEYRRPN